jgi:phosphoglycolate phosphatase-like HAD superfamily hydrolase
VLFDIDGTLIHTKGVGVQAFGKALESEFNQPDVSHRMRFGGRTDPSLVREVFHHANIEHTEQNVGRFFDAYVFWLDHLLSESDKGGACPGVRDFLRAISDLPNPPVVGLLTGNIRLGAEIKLRRFDLWESFQVGAYGDDDEDRNRIANVALQRGREALGNTLRGEELLVVGDTPRDIECGRAVGAQVLAVATGGAKPAELEAHRPDWLAPSLEQVNASDVCGR